MTALTVVYDANILYPAPLRDLFVRLTFTDLFRAKWTGDIHDEWTKNVLENRPDISRNQLERTRQKMDAVVEDCLVTDYESFIPSLKLPDADDRHVLAAAIAAQANVIITFNLKDFPAEVLKPYGVEAQHPDRFVSHLLDLDVNACLSVIKIQRESLQRPPVNVAELLETFERLGLSESVSKLTMFQHLL